jgi:hypothetical protein
MIGTIRKHQNWLWGVVIAATIFSFVYYLSPAQRYGAGTGFRDGSTPDLGSINGEPVTMEQLRNAERECRLIYFLQTHAWPDPSDANKQIRHRAEQNLVIQSLLKEYKIIATTDAAARFTKQIFGVPPEQAMPVDKFNDWVQNELMRRGELNLDDFDRFARHQAAQDYLMSLFGMSGKLITPAEEEFFYRRENEPIATEIASFPVTNFYSTTPPSETNLQDYFTKHEAEYRLPDRVQINYVLFDPSNYMATASKLMGTNVEEKTAELYHQQGPDAFKDESGKTLSEAEAEARLKKQMLQYASFQEARKAANELLTALSEKHDEAHPYTTSDLEKLAKARDLPYKTTEPFDEKNGCKDLVLPAKAMHLLFTLRAEAPDDPERSLLYAPAPLLGESNVYVAGLQMRLPSQLQPLAAVRDQVLKDYRDSKALELAKEAGEQFASAVQFGLTQGKSFDAVCAAQKIKPETLPPFALVTTNPPAGLDKLSFQHLQEGVFPVPTEQSTRYIPITDGGLVAYVKARLPVDEVKMKEELPYYLARMREQRQFAAFQEWLTRQLQLRWIPPPGEQGSAG